MMPWRLMRPTVGLIPTSIVALDGLRIEPEVSVPTLAAHRLAATPMPELDPPVFMTGRPSLVSSRGSRRGSYGFIPYPPTELWLPGMPLATQLASSVFTVLAMMIAPASRRWVTSVAS